MKRPLFVGVLCATTWKEEIWLESSIVAIEMFDRRFNRSFQLKTQ